MALFNVIVRDPITYEAQFYDERFHKEITIPANATTTGTEEIEAGKDQGAIQIAVVAAGDVAIADGKKVTLTLKAADKVGGTYTTVFAQDVFTASGASTFKKGELIGMMAVADNVMPVWKVDIATDDTGATGKVDVIPYYMSR